MDVSPDQRQVCDCGAPLRIGAAARHFGVSVETLRYYESEGLVTPLREPSGHRVYDAQALDALHVVVAMRAVGFGIGEVRELIDQKTGEAAEVLVPRVRALLGRYRHDLARRRREIDAADGQLQRWLSDLDSTGF